MTWAFSSWVEFFEMGKHGHFVWICVLLTIVAFIALFVVEHNQHKFLSRMTSSSQSKIGSGAKPRSGR